ncbi:MAG: hypothetical protein PHP30_08860 [Bacteroidales bacterium]|nr:hypothetical protein [Bacteroidales bacterium]MDD3990188.1 hypothetical protein [Bacteroidales bacterium]MDD4639104.1 hypothetical protein [Bacteroidales bacterium]
MKTKLGLFLLIVAVTLGSCQFGVPYKYVEVIKEVDNAGNVLIKEKTPADLTAKNQDDAYLEAFRTFATSLKSYMDKRGFWGSENSLPLRFKLIGKKGDDITQSASLGKESLEAEIERSIFMKDFLIRKFIERGGFEELTAMDTAAYIESLKEYISVSKRDEFDPDQTLWYRPKSASASPNKVYCYFSTRKGEPGEMRLRIEFYADAHIFFRNVFFAANEEAFEYTPSGTRTNIAADGYVTEWSDDIVKEKHWDMIKALAKADSAKMKLIGTQFSRVRVLSKEQIRDFGRILDYYKLLGGEF